MAGIAPSCSAVRLERGPLPRARPACELDLEVDVQALLRQPLRRPVAHPRGDVVAEVGDAGDAADPRERAALGEDPGLRRRRLDPGVELAAAAGVEAGRGHRQGDRHAEGREVAAPGLLEER